MTKITIERKALEAALERMDRARAILTDNNPRPECNWGMLDTSDLRAALAAQSDTDVQPDEPVNFSDVQIPGDDDFNRKHAVWGYTADQMRAYAKAYGAACAAAERERCAKVCDDMHLYTGYDCAAAIRKGE
jgi:hypothetical protein